MSQVTEPPFHPPQHFQGYLLLLARRRFDPRLTQALDPSDLVQQTLVAAIEKLETFRGRTDAEMAAWLRTILANKLALASRRAAGRARSLEEALALSSARLETLLAGEGASPYDEAARVEDAVRLASALVRLPEDQRTAIELRHLEALPVADVATRMGRTAGAVAGLLQRGARRLKELMNEST